MKTVTEGGKQGEGGDSKEGNVLFNDALNTFCLWLRTIHKVREETR